MRTRIRETVARRAAIGAAIAMVGLGFAPVEAALGASPIAVPCSTAALAAVISSAPDGSLLALAPFCTYSVITPLPDITGSLSMFGSSTTIRLSSLATVPASSLLTVDTGGNLSLTNVNVSGGNAVSGGAISNLGRLAISGGIFSRDQAGDTGGAINNGGTLAVTGANFTEDRTGLYGGAIGNGATATIRNCSFISNSAHQGGAIANIPIKKGPILPGIRASSEPNAQPPSPVLTVAGSSFTRNIAEMGGADFGLSQQAFTNDSFTDNGNTTTDGAGAIFNDDAPLILTRSTLSGNQAGQGGAILDNSGGTLTSDNLTNNVADATVNGGGGGIYYEGQILISDSKISGNYAAEDGGGVFARGPGTISGTQIFKNQARVLGGGIYNHNSTVMLSHSPVYTNTPDNCAPAGSIPGCAG